jgi:hypothetical protein
MAGGRPVVGLAPKASGSNGRPVVGLAPKGSATGSRLVVGLPGSHPAKKEKGGFLHGLAKYSGAEILSNLGKDIGTAALEFGPGAYEVGKAAAKDTKYQVTGGAWTHKEKKSSHVLDEVVKPAVRQYKDYYGHDLGHHIYTHPLQPILDAATIATGGAGAAAKLGKVAADAGKIGEASKLAKLGERATLETRSPRKIATGKGPSHRDITSDKPLVKGREQLAARVRANRPEGTLRVGGELKAYGKQIQSRANQNAMRNIAPYDRYHRATRRLSHDEWTALHIRAMDIHPTDLARLWKGTPLEKVIADPTIQKLVTTPSKRMARAEPHARMISAQGAKLYKDKGLLKDETASARAELTKQQAADILGRPVKEIHGDPYYFPHTMEPARNANPLTSGGGGKGVPRPPGSTKQNLGVLALRGKLHLRTDVLGPEFLRRVKYVKYDEVHNALVRGAVRLTHQQIEHEYGGHLPKGWEYVRTKPVKIEKTVSAEPDPNQLLIPGTQGATKTQTVTVGGRSVPATIRGEGDQRLPLDKLIPDPGDLHDSQLAKDGFSTTDPKQAHQSGGAYYIVPKSTVKAATGEFTRSSDFTHAFIKRPLSVWRAAVLGLRVGFLTNNLVGNSIMYAAHTGGHGALRDLFMAIRESHGRETALKVLDDPATPPALRTDLYKEFFPEQIQGTFGRTQSPATSAAHLAGRKTVEVARAVTGAIPKLTSKVAEEYPRRALIRNEIRRSPEFKKAYAALPAQTRSFEIAARRVLEGKGGPEYQRYISKKVNQSLGDYLNLSPFERNVLRNTLPFYSWYRAITTTTYHLAADTPLRANAIAQIGWIGRENDRADVPSFLRGLISLGDGANGTKKALATQGLNPYSSLEQLRRGATADFTDLGVNPFLLAFAKAYADGTAHGGSIAPGKIAYDALVGMARGLPPSRLIKPMKPSALYPNRDRHSELLAYLGVPVKEYSPGVAAQQAAQGR